MLSAAVVIDVLRVNAMFFFFFFFFFQITNDKEHRMSVFRHHFLHHPGTGGHIKEWKKEINLSKDIKWTLKTEKVWTWEQNAVSISVIPALAWMTWVCEFVCSFIPSFIQVLLSTLNEIYKL